MPPLQDRHPLARASRVLLGVGLLLLGGVAAAAMLLDGGDDEGAPTTPAPPPATTQPPPPTTTAPAVPEGFAVYDLAVIETGPFSATVSWRTTEPARSRLVYGLAGSEPTLWTPLGDEATEHTAALPGLSFGTGYHVEATAARDGETVSAAVDLTTAPAPGDPAASTTSGYLVVDGQPVFPFLVWAACPDTYGPLIATGITFFAQNPCGGLDAQAPALAGKALSIAAWGDTASDGPGVVGWFYPDEADAREFTGATLPSAPDHGEGYVTFLTITNHFYSAAAPLPQGRAIYPGLIERTDVVGYDLYPLQDWCQSDRFADLQHATRELVAAAGGRPTFAWIETGTMRCNDPAHAVTADTIRAESWLAVVGGARGLGFFPHTWTAEPGQGVADVTRRVRELGPALLGPERPIFVSPGAGPVYATAREHNGALYVVAVNSGPSPARADFELPGLDGRALRVIGEGRSVGPDGEAFADDFAPLAAHVYVAPPADAGS
jgi:hypothetical protein